MSNEAKNNMVPNERSYHKDYTGRYEDLELSVTDRQTDEKTKMTYPQISVTEASVTGA
jgi:hypothetical protein